AALMGATLPVLVARLERERVGAIMARLYALNTLGAVAGTITGGFALLPGVGLTVTTWIAAALNVAAALVAWRVPARGDASQALGIGDASPVLLTSEAQTGAPGDESGVRTQPSSFAALAG